MSLLGYLDIAKLTFKILGFKYEQSKLTTGVHVTVQTVKGAVRGLQRLTIWSDLYYSFEGIPYAKPPLGDLRFRAPLAADPWSGVLDCTRPAEKPLQTNKFFRKFAGSEDCLYVNVYTKDVAPATRRPVMVWIFGGGFQIGEASRDMYSPDFFMSKDVVLVTIAYRLGAFGFLSLNDPSVQVPGNAGIKDQILSLKWVQENIDAFGGDPNNVTLFGESAGGTSAHLCMLSEQSKGLIHKSIVMSGSALCPWARTPTKNWGYRLAKKLGYSGEDNDKQVFAYLQQAKGTDIIDATSTLRNKEEKHLRIMCAFSPVVEPYPSAQCIFTENLYEVMQKSWSNQIPLLIGGTSFEGLLFYAEVKRRPATLTEVGNCKNLLPLDAFPKEDSDKLDDYGQRLKQDYFGDAECDMHTMMTFLELESHREFWHPMYRTALARLRHSTAPTYLYRFDYDSKDGNAVRNILCGRDIRGVCHGDELCYLYHTMFSHRAVMETPEHFVTRAMIDMWTSFATHSDPNCQLLGDVQFRPLSKDTAIKCLNISKQMEYIDLPEVAKFKVWNSFYPHGKL